MSTSTRSRRRRSRRGSVHKANGVLLPQVLKAGPERFGIVCVDDCLHALFDVHC